MKILNGITLTGQFQASAGTSAAPSISAINDTNTGFFFPAADTIAIAEGGSEVLRITSGSSIGIGTTSPTAKVDVVGEIRTSDKFGYGASAYTQYNSTTKSIDFIFV